MGNVETGEAAFIWESGVGMRALEDVLANVYSLDLTGSTLEWLSDISYDDDRWHRHP